jgi:hypothetical protein
MKRYLLTAAIVFIALLAVSTACLCNWADKPSEIDFGSYIVAANEIEQLIANDDTAAAEIRANELKATPHISENQNSEIKSSSAKLQRNGTMFNFQPQGALNQTDRDFLSAR